MNVLLIGGNGFVGKALIKSLKNNVSYLSRTSNKSEVYNNIKWIQADIFKTDLSTLNIKNIDIAIHLIGTIKNKSLYKKLNTDSVAKTIELCKIHGIKKLVFLSANGGFNSYMVSKLAAENLVKESGLNYLIVKPGLMYGSHRLSSYINILPIKIFAALGFDFFKNVYPLPVDKVAQVISYHLENNINKNILTLNDIKNFS